MGDAWEMLGIIISLINEEEFIIEPRI